MYVLSQLQEEAKTREEPHVHDSGHVPGVTLKQLIRRLLTNELYTFGQGGSAQTI